MIEAGRPSVEVVRQIDTWIEMESIPKAELGSESGGVEGGGLRLGPALRQWTVGWAFTRSGQPPASPNSSDGKCGTLKSLRPAHAVAREGRPLE